MLSATCPRPPDRWEKLLTKGDSENLPFGAMVEYYPTSARDQSRPHQCDKKVLPGIFLRMCNDRGRIWKGDALVADIEELDNLEALEIHARRLNAKEMLKPKKSGTFCIPNRGWNSKIVWKRSWSPRIHSNAGPP